MEGLSKELIFTVEDSVGILTLNRPDKRNAMTATMCRDIQRVLEEAKRRDEIKVIVITGNGPGFCSGSDAEMRLLPRIVDDHYVPLEKTRSELLESVMLSLAPALYRVGKPSIAAINGVAAGAGLSIALLCDIRIASEKAKFAASWINVGLIPDVGATFALPRIIGADKALKFVFTGELIDANQAERMSLVTQVVPHDDLMKITMDLATRIAKGPSVAMELAKQAVYEGLVNNLESQLYFEAYAQNTCFMTEDFREGVNAFKEKRRPKFKGL